jgi:hypothetical protein
MHMLRRLVPDEARQVSRLAESQRQALEQQSATNHGRGRGRCRSPGRSRKGADVLGK